MAGDAAFSVALCTYNGEAFLQAQLDSIAAQTVLPAELVACDDGSSDGTVGLLQRFARHAPFPVRIQLNAVNLGVARNFFQAARLCRSEWVLFCDQDDIWLPERIATFRQALDRDGRPAGIGPAGTGPAGTGPARAEAPVLLLSDGHLVTADGQPMDQLLLDAYRLSRRERAWIHAGQAERALVRHVFATGAAMAVHRAFLEGLPEPEAGFLHDEWIAWFASPRLRLIEQPTFCYRQHGRQQTGIDGSLRAQAKRLGAPDPRSVVTVADAADRFSRLLARLAEHEHKALSARQVILAEKLRFLEKRRNLSSSAVRRALQIAAMPPAAYGRYGDGLRTLAKDLLGTGRL